MFICKWCNKTKEELNITNCGSHSRHCKLRPSETKPIIKRTRSPDEDILILRRKETLMLRMQDPEFKSQYLVKCRSTAKKKKDAGYVRPKCTDEAKAKIGMARKKFLAENPDKHPWKDKNKFKSVPCLKVKEFLKDNGIVFIEEFCPMPDRAFSIDIAFPDIKLGIEINGNQHYLSDGILAPYYKDRHDIIIASGWNLIELHYSCVYNNDILYNLLNDIIMKNPSKDYSIYAIQNFERRNAKINAKIKLEEERKNNIKVAVELKRIETNLKIDKVLNSGIDFSKFGWVNEVANLLSIRFQKVSIWMKCNMLEFYNTKCFIRKQNFKTKS